MSWGKISILWIIFAWKLAKSLSVLSLSVFIYLFFRCDSSHFMRTFSNFSVSQRHRAAVSICRQTLSMLLHFCSLFIYFSESWQLNEQMVDNQVRLGLALPPETFHCVLALANTLGFHISPKTRLNKMWWAWSRRGKWLMEPQNSRYCSIQPDVD